MVIYKGKSVQQQWFPTNLDKFSRWHFTATENGWATDSTAQEWPEKVFIPSTALPDPQEPRLLVLDAHGSHETTEFMYACFMHNIYLLLLPPHSSHFLQSLDLSIFSLLKATYRRELNNLSLLSDSTPIGERNFLLCYQKARERSLIPKNIKAGWKAAGLRPLNMAKTLMSRLLVENSNNDSVPAPEDLIKEERQIWNENISAIQWETPRKARDVRLQADIITRLGETDLPTRRQLFKNLAKGWDEKYSALAQAELRIKQLETRIEGSQPKKRRKVRVSPNSKFASVRAIKVAKIEAGDRNNEEGDSNAFINTEATCDCIEVQRL